MGALAALLGSGAFSSLILKRLIPGRQSLWLPHTPAFCLLFSFPQFRSQCSPSSNPGRPEDGNPQGGRMNLNLLSFVCILNCSASGGGEQLLPESATAESKGKWIGKADGSTVHTAAELTSLSLEPQGGSSRLVPPSHPRAPALWCTRDVSL